MSIFVSRRVRLRAIAALALPVTLLGACSSSGGDEAGPCTMAEKPIINFVAYSTPREVYGKIIPAFQSMWKEEHNDQSVIFQELAEKTALTRNYIGMVERGETNPTLGVMASLATVLGTTVASLVRSAEEAQARQSESPMGGTGA